MLLVYAVVLALLGALRFVVARRAASLERRYVRLAREAERLLREATYRDGNSNRGDAGKAARRQYELGRVVIARDRLEAKQHAWQARADRLGSRIDRLRTWKGRKLPYAVGALDAALVLYLLDRTAALDPERLLRLVASASGQSRDTSPASGGRKPSVGFDPRGLTPLARRIFFKRNLLDRSPRIGLPCCWRPALLSAPGPRGKI